MSRCACYVHCCQICPRASGYFGMHISSHSVPSAYMGGTTWPVLICSFEVGQTDLKLITFTPLNIWSRWRKLVVYVSPQVTLFYLLLSMFCLLATLAM